MSRKNVEVSTKDVAEARKTYEKEIEKFKIGESSRPEIGEAKFSYYRNLDTLQQRRTQQIETERQFRQLIGLPGFDNRRIIVEMPEGEPSVDVDWHESVDRMLQMRPDLLAQRIRLDAVRMQYELAADQCKPDVSLESFITKSGFDSDFDGSVQQLVDGEDFNWMFGVSHRRGLNRYDVKSAMRRSNLLWAKEQATTRKGEYAAIHALQSSYASLVSAVQRLQQMKNVRAAAEERFAAYKEKYELGELAIELYIRAQASRSAAELQEEMAKVQLMQSSVNFEFTRGTLLDVRSVEIRSREPNLLPTEPELHLAPLPEPALKAKPPNAPPIEEMLKDAKPEVRQLLQQPADDVLEVPTFEEMLQDASPKIRELLSPSESNSQ